MLGGHHQGDVEFKSDAFFGYSRWCPRWPLNMGIKIFILKAFVLLLKKMFLKWFKNNNSGLIRNYQEWFETIYINSIVLFYNITLSHFLK